MMPNYFTGHIDKWLLLSEAETDFAIFFVRSWITFNAWYCNSYNNYQDRYCIDQIKTDTNHFRARMFALIGGSDQESERFRWYFKQLYELLEQYPIPDASPERRVTFSNIFCRPNPVTSIPPKTKRNLEYKTEILADKSVRAVVVNKNTAPSTTRYQYTHSKYDFEHFQGDLATCSLTSEQKLFLIDGFLEINPKRKENLVSKKQNGGVCIGGAYFNNDIDLLSKALIEVLYLLRCKLFHGELQPTRDNLKVYEPAYHILRMLLPSLR